MPAGWQPTASLARAFVAPAVDSRRSALFGGPMSGLNLSNSNSQEYALPKKPTSQPMPSRPVVRFEVFRGTFASWPDLFEQAAEFATRVGRDRLITISHSEDKDDG